ncbi:MAG: hypothetical protein WC421_08195 [Elusimicrobiales bacterium]
MRIEALAAQIPAWISQNGPEGDCVLWTRARLRRNLAGQPFPARAVPAELRRARELILKKLSVRPEMRGSGKIRLDIAGAFEQRLLAERGLAAEDFPAQPRFCAAAVSPGEEVCALVNWRDALSLSFTGAGLCARATLEAAARFDAAMGAALDYAWDRNFGWLSSSPENAGTGLQLSALLHIPCLARSGRAEGALKNLSNLRAGWKADGPGGIFPDFCEIFTACPFGSGEEAMLENISSAAHFLITAERQARDWLFSGPRAVSSEDEAWRACGLLGNARVISYEEARGRISAVLMGLAAGLPLPVRREAALKLFALCRPAHIAQGCRPPGKRKFNPAAVTAAERDIRRAAIIRAALKA